MIEGVWWPAGQPELRYAGTLDIKNGNAVLTLTSPPAGQEVFALGSALTLHGESRSGSGITKYTLWGAEGTYFHHEDATTHSRRVVYVVAGDHLEAHETARFACSAVSFHDLAMWSRVVPPIPNGTAEEDAPQHLAASLVDVYADVFGPGYRVEVSLEYPQRIETDGDYPQGAIRGDSGEKTRVVFLVDPPAPAHLHELLLRDMQALLTFSYLGGAPVTGQWLGTSPETLQPIVRADTFRDRLFVHRGGFQMLLTTEVSAFAHLVAEWWGIQEDLFPAPQVVTMYLHTSRGLLEQSTASALAATENLHSYIGPTQHRFDPTYLAERALEIRAQYPGAEYAPFRAYLYEKFQDNRPTLQTRLEELRDLIGLERLPMMAIDESAWISLFKTVRNKLAHTGAHVLRRGEASDDLELINSQTRLILAMLLLTQMHLADSALDRAARVMGTWPHRVELATGTDSV